jgi:hypothetical protein
MHEPADKAGSVHCTEVETGQPTSLFMASVSIENTCLVLQYDVLKLAQAIFYIHSNPLHTPRRTDNFSWNYVVFKKIREVNVSPCL